MSADRVITAERQEMVARALEEAAVRVRQCIPDSVEMDVEDDIDRVHVGGGQSLPGVRSPRLRAFRIEW